MANVSFLTGSQSKLDTLTSYTAGAFYLTSDTDRLYFAQSASELVRLNRHVVQVDSISKLPTDTDVSTGDFYYAKAENILCTYVNGKWQQINPNTNTESYVSGVTSAVATSGTVGTNGKITVTLTLAQDRYNQITGDEITNDTSSYGVTDRTVTFDITEAELYKVIHKPQVDVGASVSGGVATVKTSGHGSNGDGYKVKGKDGITVTTEASFDGYVIDGTTYGFSNLDPSNNSTPTTTLTLKDSDGETDSVAFEVESNKTSTETKNLTITPTAGKITINHSKTSQTKSTATTGTGNTYGKTITYIDAPTFDAGGHVTGYTTGTAQLPIEQDYEVTAVSANNEGKITVAIKDNSTGNSGNQSTLTSGKDIYFKVGNDKHIVYNQNDLDVYTKAEVDSKLQIADAMRFKGSIASGSALTALTGVQIGDTYKITAAGDYTVSVNGEAAKKHYCDVGDLVIATGTEWAAGENGATASNIGTIKSVTWVYVPSGDDTDTQYTYYLTPGSDSVDTHLLDSTNQVGDQTIRFKEGDKLEVVGTAATDTDPATIKFSHAKITTSKPAALTPDILTPKSKITVVTDATADTFGHITKLTTTQFTLPDERAYSLILNSTDPTTVQLMQSDDDGTESTGNIKFAAGSTNDSLSVTGNATSKIITYSHKSFNATPTASSATDIVFESGANPSLYAITGVTLDNGHLTGITKTKVTTKISEVTDFQTTATVSNNVVTITDTVSQNNSQSNTLSDAFKLKTSTSSVKFSVTEASGTTPAIVGIDLEWKSF